MLHLRSLLCITAASVFLLACDKKPEEDKTADKAADKAADEAPDKAPEPAKPEAKHFDIGHDKSGVLARSAAAIEVTDATAEDAALREHLADVSHHAENLPSVEKVCAHMLEIRKSGDAAACAKDLEHHVVRLGPELYGEFSACVLEAKTPEEIDVCEAAEKEAELLLHDKPHGEGLPQETCDSFFAHFEQLAMDDAGDHADAVKEILEEVKIEILATCVDQGTKAEVDCAMAAKTLAEVKDCSSIL